MKEFNDSYLDPTATDMSGSIHSLPINVSEIEHFTIQPAWTGSPVGYWTVDWSDAKLIPLTTEWTNLTGNVMNINGAGGGGFFVANTGFKWARATYVPTSGSGTLTSLRANGKGP